MAALLDRVRTLAATRDALLDRLAALPAAAHPLRDGEAWSPLMVVEHVLLAERGMLGQIERQLAKGTPRRGPRSRWRQVALALAFRSPLRFKMPGAVADLIAPTGTLDLDALRAMAAELTNRWTRLAAELPPALAHEGLARHPVTGPLSLADALAFLTEHARHHRPQLGRALAHATRAAA